MRQSCAQCEVTGDSPASSEVWRHWGKLMVLVCFQDVPVLERVHICEHLFVFK